MHSSGIHGNVTEQAAAAVRLCAGGTAMDIGTSGAQGGGDDCLRDSSLEQWDGLKLWSQYGTTIYLCKHLKSVFLRLFSFLIPNINLDSGTYRSSVIPFWTKWRWLWGNPLHPAWLSCHERKRAAKQQSINEALGICLKDMEEPHVQDWNMPKLLGPATESQWHLSNWLLSSQKWRKVTRTNSAYAR